MINYIKITNHLNESITIETRFPEKSGFLIKSIDGLNPTKADINTTDVANFDGGVFNSSRASKRNLVLTLLFYGNDIELIRRNLYKYFPIKKEIQIEIHTNNRIVKTSGYIESNEINIFSSEEGSIISIICPEAYFSGLDLEFLSFSSIIPTFKFPFANNDVTGLRLLKFGDIILETTKNIYYEGEASTGLIIYIHIIGPATNIEIINNKTLGSIFIDTLKLSQIQLLGPLTAGDDILISTIKGNKYVHLIRNGTVYNILNAIGSDPEWFQLEQGDNLFTYTAEIGVENLEFQIQNSILYEGI